LTSDSNAGRGAPRPARDRLGPTLAALALVVALLGVAGSQWSSWRLSARMDRIEHRLVAVAKARDVRAPDGPRRPGRARRPNGKGGGRARKAARARKAPVERQERVREEVTASIEGFATERGLDDATVGHVLGELEARNDAVRAVFQDLAAGAVSVEQAREEVQWVRDESADALRELLGDELYDALDAHLAERSPRRRRAAVSKAPDEPATSD